MAPELTPEAWAEIRTDYEHTERPVAEICAEHGISTGTLRDRVRRWRWTRRRLPIPLEGPPPASMSFPSPAQRERVASAESAFTRVFDTLCGEPDEGDLAVSPPSPASLTSFARHPLPQAGEGTGGTDFPKCEPPSPLQDESPLQGEQGQLACDATSASEPDNSAIVPRLQSAVARVLPAIEATVARLAAGPTHPREMERAARALAALTRTLRELNSLLSQRQAAAASALPYDDMPEDIDAFRHELARRITLFVESRTGQTDSGAEPQGT